MPTTVLYHDDCLDGFTSAWIFQRVQPDVVLIPSNPNPTETDVEGNVYCLDCCFAVEDLSEVLENPDVNSVTVIDHHVTNLESLEDFEHPKLTKIIDMDLSGAGLTWNYLHPDKKMPSFVNYVQQLDLWNMDYPNVCEMNSYISSLDRTLEAWESAYQKITTNEEMVIDEAKDLYEKDVELIQDICSNPIEIEVNGYKVLAAEAPKRYVSKVGLKLAEGHAFGVAYVVTEDYIEYSLRSVDSGIDVEKIAYSLGGGGHEHRAAFRLDRSSDLNPVKLS